jgi:transposase
MLLKVEVFAYLSNLSERQVEVYMNENLPAKFFIGLAVDGKAPDHSTLTHFRERLLNKRRIRIFEEMMQKIIQQAMSRKVKFGSVQKTPLLN